MARSEEILDHLYLLDPDAYVTSRPDHDGGRALGALSGSQRSTFDTMRARSGCVSRSGTVAH